MWNCGHIVKYYFLLSDAIILNSLCEMFGLLDSVKKAVDVRRQNQETKPPNSVNGEETAQQSSHSESPLGCFSNVLFSL